MFAPEAETGYGGETGDIVLGKYELVKGIVYCYMFKTQT